MALDCHRTSWLPLVDLMDAALSSTKSSFLTSKVSEMPRWLSQSCETAKNSVGEIRQQWLGLVGIDMQALDVALPRNCFTHGR